MRAILLLSAVLCSLVGARLAQACTGIRLKPGDGSIIAARTMEFAADLRSNIVVIPRRYDYQGTAPGNKPGLKWTTRYGVAGANGFDLPLIVDGLNERGLAVGVFYFPGYAQYQSVSPAELNRALGPWELPTYLLTTCASVDEALAALDGVRVGAAIEDHLGFAPPCHYLINDSLGRCVVVEYVDGKLKTYDNVLGVMSNSPTFDWHLTNLRNYVNLTVTNVPPVAIGDLKLSGFGQGTGTLGLPGDFTPPSRFVRAAFFSQSALPVATAQEGVEQAFHLLNQFDIPKRGRAGTGRWPYRRRLHALDVGRRSHQPSLLLPHVRQPANSDGRPRPARLRFASHRHDPHVRRRSHRRRVADGQIAYRCAPGDSATRTTTPHDMQGISVVIPCYNGARFLRQCLDSALAQTYQGPVELLVCDDGSQDDSRAIVSACAPQAKLLEHPGGLNAGVSATRNRCIRAASHGLIAFLDCDDYWLPNHLAQLVDELDRHPEIAMVCDIGCDVSDDGQILNERKPSETAELRLEDVFMNTNFPPTAALVRRPALESVGLFNESFRYGEDYDQWLRVLERYPARCVQQDGFRYRIHGNQATQQFRMWRGVELVVAAAVSRRPYPPALVRKRRAVIKYRQALTALGAGKRWHGAWLLSQAVALDPGRAFSELGQRLRSRHWGAEPLYRDKR